MKKSEFTFTDDFYSAIGMLGILMNTTYEPNNKTPKRDDIGEDIYLVPLNESELKKFHKGKQSSTGGYSFLYRNNIKLSDNVFRVGGMGGKFKDGYCSLLFYGTIKNPDTRFSGHDCLIDKNANIVLTQNSCLDHIYHIGGVVASLKYQLINLLDGSIILDRYSKEIQSKDFIFATTCSIGVNKVYKIEKKTGEVEIFED